MYELVEVNVAPRHAAPEWVQAWLVRQSARFAWVKFTTRGDDTRVAATSVRRLS